VQVKELEIPYKCSDKEFKLYCLGDIHAGTVHCVEDKVKAKVQEIAQNKNAMWIGMGDYGEWITPKDKRFDPNQCAIADWVEPDNIGESQTKWIVDLFSPIKDKCIGLLYGNHEDSIRVYNHENVQKNICERLGVDNLGYSAFIRMIFTRGQGHYVATGAFTHGAGCAITEGAKINSLTRFMKSTEADIYGYAHLHDYIPKSFSRLVVNDKGNIKSKVAIGAITGSWFRTYTQGVIASYGERKCYPPTEICCAVFSITAPYNGSENGKDTIKPFHFDVGRSL
jgi:hypothetical protein